MTPENSDELQRLRQGSGKPAGRSCLSMIFGFFCSAGFILSGLVVAFALFLLRAPRDEVLIAAGFFLFAFIMQWRAARVGCFRPVFIFAVYLFLETGLIGVIMFQTGAYKHIDFDKIRQTLKREAPQLQQFATRVLDTAVDQTRGAMGGALDAAKSAVEGFRSDNRDQRLAELEAAFQENPGDPAAVFALANGYMAKDDLLSVQLAIALYKALVETGVSDVYLERLATAYLRIFRYDLAFSTAARRIWLPYCDAGLVARQIAMIAVSSGDLEQGISELEKLLLLSPVEESEVRLLLASMYEDSGKHERARALAGEIIAVEPSDEQLAIQAAALIKQIEGK